MPDAKSSLTSQASCEDGIAITYRERRLQKLLERLTSSSGRSLPKHVTDLRLNETYPAVVKSGQPQGVFVYLSPSIQARIKLSELPESPVDPTQVTLLYPKGKVLRSVRVVDFVQREAQTFIEVSLKHANTIFVTIDALNKGDIVAARVKKRLASGLIVRLEQSLLDAFCYVDDIDDGIKVDGTSRAQKKLQQEQREKALSKHPLGDRVAARVLETDLERGRVRVTLKPSAFAGLDSIQTLQEQLEEESEPVFSESCRNASEYTKLNVRGGIKQSSDSEDECGIPLLLRENATSSSESIKSDVEAGSTLDTSRNLKIVKFASHDPPSQLSINMQEAKKRKLSSLHTLKTETLIDRALAVVPIATSAELSESAGTTGKVKRLRSAAVDLDSDNEEQHCLSEDDDAENNFPSGPSGDATTKRRQRRLTVAAKKREELSIRAKELEDATADGLKAETVSDFERLVATNSGASGIWIRYIAFHLKLKNLEKAREVANRALDRISGACDEQERFNVWIAYLNMEATFGTPATQDAVLNRALQYNDAKRIYWHLTFMYQRQQKHKECIEACRKCVNKYPESKKMWIRYITCLFEVMEAHETSVDVTVRGILVRALRRLPQRKHAAVLSATARLEFKYGSVERGCTYFDKFLMDHPKRTDIWGQWFDSLMNAVKQNKISVATARAIFEKPIGMATTFKPRQMKFFFTRWLAFEQTYGTDQSQQRVESDARNYVAQIQNLV